MDFVAASPVLVHSKGLFRPDAFALNPMRFLRRLARSLRAAPWRRRTSPAVAPRQAKIERSPKDELFERGEEMLRQARRDNQPLSLLVFELDDLPELQSVFGPRLVRTVRARTSSSLRCLGTSRGLAAWTTATTFTVVVPAVPSETVATALEATLGTACCIELDLGDDEIILVPEFRVQTVGETVSLEQAYGAACRDIANARIARQRRQTYLARERESHSRPGTLQATVTLALAPANPVDDGGAVYAPMAGTMSVPFGPRR